MERGDGKMKVEYDITLPEPVSQIAFGELKTELTVTIVNAEALAIQTAGKLWWSSVDKKFYVDHEPDAYNLKLAVEEAIKFNVQQIAMDKRRKDITIDCLEIISRVLSTWKEEEK